MSKRHTLTPEIAEAVAAEFNEGNSLPAAIEAIGREKIHVVSAEYWRLEGESDPFGSFKTKKERNAAIRAARKAGQRREVVAARFNATDPVSVSEIKKVEGKRPIYTGKGTKAHLAN